MAKRGQLIIFKQGRTTPKLLNSASGKSHWIILRRHGVGGADERATRSASSLAHAGKLLVRVKEGTKWRVPLRMELNETPDVNGVGATGAI
jgi:hypothetical protein